MPAGNQVQIVLSMNADTYSAAIDKAQKQLNEFKGKAEQAGKSIKDGLGGTEAAERIRLLGESIGIRLPRALTNVIVESEAAKAAVGALSTAIIGIGSLAVGAEIFKRAIEGINKFYDRLDNLPDAIKTGFGSMIDSTRASATETDILNDKMQQSIDKLEHRPSTNGPKLALDEAYRAAEKLSDKLDAILGKITEVTAKDSVSTLESMVSDKAGTGGTVDIIKGWQTQVQQVRDKLQTDTLNHASKDQIDRDTQAILDKLHAAASALAQEASNNKRGINVDSSQERYHTTGDLSAQYQLNMGAASLFGSQADSMEAQKQSGLLSSRQSADEARKAAADAGSAAASKASKAALDRDQAALDARYLDPSKDASKISAYWMAIVQASHKGSAEYKGAMERLIASNREQWRAVHAMVDKQSKEPLPLPKMAQLNDFVPKDLNKKLDDLSLTLSDKAALSTIKARNEMDEYTISLKVASGAMTEQQAALARMGDHAAENAAELKALTDALDKLKAEGTYNPITHQNEDIGNARQQGELENQIASTQSAGQLQAAKDAQAAYLTTAVGGVSTALTEFAAKVTNVGQVLGELMMHSLSSVNNAILNPGHAGSHTWGKVGLGIGKNAASAGLNFGEGKVMDMLGIGGHGKLGTKSNAMWVRMADASHAVGSGIASLFHHKSGASTSDALSAVSGMAGTSGGGKGMMSSIFSMFGGGGMSGHGGIGGILKSAMGFLPMLGFASGGNANAGQIAMVGEHGPELAYFGANAHITPNQSLHSAIGSPAGSTVYNVDARNSTNPAQTAAYVHHAIMQSQHHAVQQSISAHHEMSKRKP